jgi:hypothetical protein
MTTPFCNPDAEPLLSLLLIAVADVAMGRSFEGRVCVDDL